MSANFVKTIATGADLATVCRRFKRTLMDLSNETSDDFTCKICQREMTVYDPAQGMLETTLMAMPHCECDHSVCKDCYVSCKDRCYFCDSPSGWFRQESEEDLTNYVIAKPMKCNGCLSKMCDVLPPSSPLEARRKRFRINAVKNYLVLVTCPGITDMSLTPQDLPNNNKREAFELVCEKLKKDGVIKADVTELPRATRSDVICQAVDAIYEKIADPYLI